MLFLEAPTAEAQVGVEVLGHFQPVGAQGGDTRAPTLFLQEAQSDGSAVRMAVATHVAEGP